MTGQVYVNNHPPVPVAETAFPADGIIFQKSVAATPYALLPLVADAEGDTLTTSISVGTLNAGLTLTSDQIQGTPTTYGSAVVTVRWTDVALEYYEEVLTIYVGDLIPNVVGMTEAAGTSAIEATANFIATTISTETSQTIPSGSIISQNPAAGTLAVDTTEVQLVVSSGSGFVGGTEKLLDVVDTLRFITNEVPEGIHQFRIYSVDDAGRLSSTYLAKVIEVTEDTSAFIADSHAFTVPGLTNMASYDLRLDDNTYYVTNMGEAFTSSPSSFSTYSGEPLANYHVSGASEWLSETHDFNLVLTGSWILDADIKSLKGTITVSLELSDDNFVSSNSVTSVEVPEGTTVPEITKKGDFRYGRVRITTTGTETAFAIAPQIILRVNVVPIEEVGNLVSASSGPVTVTLRRQYSAVKLVTATAQGAAGLSAVVDNIVLGNPTTFDVYAFDIFGDQAVVPVTWLWQGV